MDSGRVAEFIHAQHLFVEELLRAGSAFTAHIMVVVALGEMSCSTLNRAVRPGLDVRDFKQVVFIVFQARRNFLEIGNG